MINPRLFVLKEQLVWVNPPKITLNRYYYHHDFPYCINFIYVEIYYTSVRKTY
ncbi:hypothetical protein BC30102_2037 [Bacillus cereus]|nr:hypothetical protein BC30102_2037 [Bacillus cereus]